MCVYPNTDRDSICVRVEGQPLCGLRLLLFLCAESERIEVHLLDHGHQSVRTGGAEVFLQTDAVDEVEVGVENLLRRVVRQDTDQKGNNTLHDDGIALTLKVNLSVHVIGL